MTDDQTRARQIADLQAGGHSVLAHKYNDLAECPVCAVDLLTQESAARQQAEQERDEWKRLAHAHSADAHDAAVAAEAAEQQVAALCAYVQHQEICPVFTWQNCTTTAPRPDCKCRLDAVLTVTDPASPRREAP